jgi:hypothetical protein
LATPFCSLPAPPTNRSSQSRCWFEEMIDLDRSQLGQLIRRLWKERERERERERTVIENKLGSIFLKEYPYSFLSSPSIPLA